MSDPTAAPLPSADIDRLTRILVAHGIQPTQQRLDIAAIFFAGDVHLSADQLIARLDAGARPVSKATVYNTLGLFTSRGLLRPVSIDSTKLFYDSNTRPHHHLYLVDDGELVDVPCGDLDLGKLPSAPADSVVEGVDVIIRIRRRARGDT